MTRSLFIPLSEIIEDKFVAKLNLIVLSLIIIVSMSSKDVVGGYGTLVVDGVRQ